MATLSKFSFLSAVANQESVNLHTRGTHLHPVLKACCIIMHPPQTAVTSLPPPPPVVVLRIRGTWSHLWIPEVTTGYMFIKILINMLTLFITIFIKTIPSTCSCLFREGQGHIYSIYFFRYIKKYHLNQTKANTISIMHICTNKDMTDIDFIRLFIKFNKRYIKNSFEMYLN